ncbi:hypothetical protein [Reichenbachiella sp. MALMAid0571]|uniref:hypothetical protein n=1 Tax=Reichenbachiella sp. MALMAid0571 TaxID=3143939 RepID=UPI0032DE876F
MKIKFLLAFTYILLVGCEKKSLVLAELDFSLWENDKFGCNGYRKDQTNLLEHNKDDLLKFSEKEIVSMLGVPNETELIDRSEKYYIYTLQGGSKCNKDNHTITYLRLRFNSLGYSKEVLILTEKHNNS